MLRVLIVICSFLIGNALFRGGILGSDPSTYTPKKIDCEDVKQDFLDFIEARDSGLITPEQQQQMKDIMDKFLNVCCG